MLAQSSPTIIWYQPHQPVQSSVLQTRQEELKTAGFEIQIHTQARNFYPVAAQAIAEMGPATPPLFIISGINSESLAALSRLRMQSVYLPIMVDFPRFIEAHILQALYSGADDFCVLDTSAALWIAKIECLLRRSRHQSWVGGVKTAAVEVAPEPVEPTWGLRDEGWVLTSPQGAAIALTTTERQFLLMLCSQPDKRASHQQLLEAISEQSDANTDAGAGHNRLGVVISRLKRKAALEGATIPIRSIYKWGYMFGASIQLL